MGIQANVVVVTPKKDGSKLSKMILSMSRMRWKTVKIQIHYMLDIMKCIRHGLLKCFSSLFKVKWKLLIRKDTPREDESGFVLV